MTPVESNSVLSATVLNRLAYGPTAEALNRIRLTGPATYIEEQLNPETLPESPPLEESPPLTFGWQHVVATGRATSSTLTLLLDDGGEAVLDDFYLVRGTAAERGANLIRNGGFEEDLSPANWQLGTDFKRSELVTDLAHSSKHALRLRAEYNPARDNFVQQVLSPVLDQNQIYTLSYWYYRDTNRPNQFYAYLLGSAPGSGLFSSPDLDLPLPTRLANAMASPDDLRAWYLQRAVNARRQLLEILLQFFNNHFVTSLTKQWTFFGNVYEGGSMIARHAVEQSYLQNEKWRAALLRQECTFYDLLRISAESPAMIIYLDTVYSSGSPGSIPTENYARELLELFTLGVDNGYDQDDIASMARVWTGWNVRMVDEHNKDNPFAPTSTRKVPWATDDYWHSLVGVWRFVFLPEFHDATEKTLFRGKTVPIRFGAPYAGREYQLSLPARGGTNGIQDGYDVLRHLANQPFTQEFISVKLCRLFVHDDFEIGYDFRSSSLSEEGRLVRSCMEAWESTEPKGQVRKVLRAIFQSTLFGSERAALQKVKTPLEFVVSSVRALQIPNTESPVDAYALDQAIERMGNMVLFDREEPNGFPEQASPWIAAGTLAERIRFVQALLGPEDPGRAGDAGKNHVDPVALLRTRLAGPELSDPANVANSFLALLYPAEGKANLDLYSRLAVNFLNSDESGRFSAFSALLETSPAFDLRIRGMVAMLMSLPRFQEQ